MMKCPYCGKEMEKGIFYIDNLGANSVVYKSEEDAKKKGLFSKIDPILWVKYAHNKEEAYHCKACKKVIAVYNEE